MNILLLGSGGREHALAWKIAQSLRLDRLYIAPGNPGTAQVGTNLPLSATDFPALTAFVLEHAIDMVVVGPEDPLVKGIYDHFAADPRTAHVPVIGPSMSGARLEGSKAFSKGFMVRHNIPTARYASVTKDKLEEGVAFLKTLKAPYVLKADGLAAGKGVLILPTIEEAVSELAAMLEGKFGDASRTVVIEEFLSGIECSVFVLTDGRHYALLPVAKDYKRIGEGDTGLNTGGMGAVSPVSFADDCFMDKVEARIIRPTVDGLHAENITYTGFIFFGLINVGGEPYVIEYNARMGDPETEVVMPRIQSDLVELLEAAANGSLNEIKVKIDPRYAVTVMLVSGGYPGDYTKGEVIAGWENTSDSLLFHAGTHLKGDALLTNGGRVLAVTSYGNTKQEALDASYRQAANIGFEGRYYRSDIGFDLE